MKLNNTEAPEIRAAKQAAKELEGEQGERRLNLDFDKVEIRSEGGKNTFTGHAIVYGKRSVDLGGFTEIIKRGAVRKALDENQDVRLLINHDSNLLLARTASKTLDLREDPKGLYCEADLPDTSYARDLKVLVERGDMNQMSFGFIVGEDRWVVDSNGEVTRFIDSIESLLDVSVVAYPAYPQTDAGVRSAEDITIAGVNVRSAGELDEVALCDLASKAYRGDIQLTTEERSLVDVLYLQETDAVSPWVAKRAADAIEADPSIIEVQDDAESDSSEAAEEDEERSSEEQTETVQFNPAVLKRKLALRARNWDFEHPEL